MKVVFVAIGVLLLLGVLATTAFVEMEAAYNSETLVGPGSQKALVLFHPSRDAHFTDELSSALADGLKDAGFTVDRATVTRDTPATPNDYALVAVVCNTYWWTPDLPTLRFLARARLEGIPTIGVIGGAGATSRSQQLLEDALRASGAKVMQIQSFWLWRPNDKQRMNEANRSVALDLARRLGVQVGSTVLHTNDTPRQ